MTYDEIISSGRLAGQTLALWQRMADYSLDGIRLGSVELETKSGSANDVFLAKKIGEIHETSLVLARAGLEKLAFTSLDAMGKCLERPDLDVRLLDGTHIGLEVAHVVATADAKHDAEMSGIERSVHDALDSDSSFAKAFGDYYLDVTLSDIDTYPRSQIASKQEAALIKSEIMAFILDGEHQRALKNDLFGGHFKTARPWAVQNRTPQAK